MESVIFHLNTVRQATLAMGGERGRGGLMGEEGMMNLVLITIKCFIYLF